MKAVNSENQPNNSDTLMAMKFPGKELKQIAFVVYGLPSCLLHLSPTIEGMLNINVRTTYRRISKVNLK